MLLYSVVVVWFARDGHRHYAPPVRPWYRPKTQASFADMLATLRCRSVEHEVSAMGLHGRGSRNVVRLLIHTVKQAALVRKSNSGRQHEPREQLVVGPLLQLLEPRLFHPGDLGGKR